MILLLIINWLLIVSGDSLFAQSNNQSLLRKKMETEEFIAPGIPVTRAKIFDKLIDEAESKGNVRIIIQFGDVFATPEREIANRKQKLLILLAPFKVNDIENNVKSADLRMTVDATALRFLKNRTNIVEISKALPQTEIWQPPKTIAPPISYNRNTKFDELIEKAKSKGAISVIVKFRGMETAAAGALEARERIMDELARYNVKVTTDWGVYVTMTVDAAALRFMKNQPFIESVGENAIGKIANRQSAQ